MLKAAAANKWCAQVSVWVGRQNAGDYRLTDLTANKQKRIFAKFIAITVYNRDIKMKDNGLQFIFS
jgi:hypothetical protein